jgi:hypothetical protein
MTDLSTINSINNSIILLLDKTDFSDSDEKIYYTNKISEYYKSLKSLMNNTDSFIETTKKNFHSRKFDNTINFLTKKREQLANEYMEIVKSTDDYDQRYIAYIKYLGYKNLPEKINYIAETSIDDSYVDIPIDLRKFTEEFEIELMLYREIDHGEAFFFRYIPKKFVWTSTNTFTEPIKFKNAGSYIKIDNNNFNLSGLSFNTRDKFLTALKNYFTGINAKFEFNEQKLQISSTQEYEISAMFYLDDNTNTVGSLTKDVLPQQFILPLTMSISEKSLRIIGVYKVIIPVNPYINSGVYVGSSKVLKSTNWLDIGDKIGNYTVVSKKSHNLVVIDKPLTAGKTYEIKFKITDFVSNVLSHYKPYKDLDSEFCDKNINKIFDFYNRKDFYNYFSSVQNNNLDLLNSTANFLNSFKLSQISLDLKTKLEVGRMYDIIDKLNILDFDSIFTEQ